LSGTRPPAADRILDIVGLAGGIVLAAILRLPDLATRGTWDADQGHDMLVLRAFVRDGVVPLLGPPTSIGTFHHGALYYDALAPAAALTGGDSPLAVVFLIALGGIVAVGVTWWLARAIGGPVAGLVAAFAMALSASSVDASTFIWNPNIIPLSSSIALAAAWRAWSTGRARWWPVSAVGVAVTMQAHVLGLTVLPIIGALLVLAIRRAAPPARATLVRATVGSLAIIALSYVPLVIHELTTGGTELHALAAYLRDGSGTGNLALPFRILVVGTRVVSWPLAGLLTDGAIPALIALVVVMSIVVLRWRAPDTDERLGVRWLGLGLLWAIVALAVLAPSLATITPGLPNDHYHAFADPIVFVLVGIGIAAAVRAWQERPVEARTWRERPAVAAPAAVPLTVAMMVAIGFIGWNAATQPPAISPDGGFPAAQTAAARIVATGTVGGSLAFRSLPAVKTAEAVTYPLLLLGVVPVTETSATRLVILCDRRFETAIGAACGGPAELASLAAAPFGGRAPALVDRFDAAPNQVISVYARP
jgi:hypothetical protein